MCLDMCSMCDTHRWKALSRDRSSKQVANTWLHAYLHTCLYTCPCTCLRTCLCTCAHTCLHLCPYSCLHACLRRCLCTCLYTCECIFLYLPSVFRIDADAHNIPVLDVEEHRTCSDAHVYTHAYTHASTHVYTCLYMHSAGMQGTGQMRARPCARG